METYNNKENTNKANREELFSSAIRAGKRTYFFDVKSTRKNDHYLTITESKKTFDKDGKVSFEKHKIFLYKEDFEKFTNGMLEAIEYIKKANNSKESLQNVNLEEETNTIELQKYTQIEFEDLAEL